MQWNYSVRSLGTCDVCWRAGGLADGQTNWLIDLVKSSWTYVLADGAAEIDTISATLNTRDRLSIQAIRGTSTLMAS